MSVGQLVFDQTTWNQFLIPYLSPFLFFLAKKQIVKIFQIFSKLFLLQIPRIDWQYMLLLLENVRSLKRGRHDMKNNDTQHNDTQRNDAKQNNTQHNDTQHNDTKNNDAYQNNTQHNDT